MEDKRGTKRSHAPSVKGSQSPSDTKTPPSVPFRSAPPPGSPSEISLHCPHSPVFEQGGPSENVPVIDLALSSDEEDFIADYSRDAEFAKQLFGDLNCDILGLIGNSKVVILSDSDEEEEVHEETTADADVMPPTAEESSTLAASAVANNEDLGKMQDNNSNDLAPEWDMGKGSSGGDEAGSP
jgi:hypothetical protein